METFELHKLLRPSQLVKMLQMLRLALINDLRKLQN